MSDTFANELATLGTDVTALTAAVTAATNEMNALVQQIAAGGGAPTADQLAQMATLNSNIAAATSALNAAVAAATTPAAPPAA